MSDANEVVDLSPFYGNKDDICPICLEIMPVLSVRATERKQTTCCRQFLCSGCQRQREERFQNADAVLQAARRAQPLDQRCLDMATKQFEQASACCLCRTPVPTSYQEAFRARLKHAKRGAVDSQYDIGRAYHEGEGTEKDPVQAVHWFKMAAAQGHPRAMREYASCLEDGTGVDKSISESRLWYEKSASTGYAVAQNDLARLLLNGEDAQKDTEEAIRLLRLSADQGFDGAQYNLAACYCNGEGVPRDLEAALDLFTKAAEQDHVVSMGEVARLLMGIAIEKYDGVLITGKCPLPRVLKWQRKAAAHGDAEAKQKVEAYEKLLSSRCAFCQNETPDNGKLLRCKKCKAMHYCSKECQMNDWKAGHKKDCCAHD